MAKSARRVAQILILGLISAPIFSAPAGALDRDTMRMGLSRYLFEPTGAKDHEHFQMRLGLHLNRAMGAECLVSSEQNRRIVDVPQLISRQLLTPLAEGYSQHDNVQLTDKRSEPGAIDLVLEKKDSGDQNAEPLLVVRGKWWLDEALIDDLQVADFIVRTATRFQVSRHFLKLRQEIYLLTPKSNRRGRFDQTLLSDRFCELRTQDQN